MISILCPTKCRPDGLKRMWNSALETSNCDLELVLYVEEYDLETLNLDLFGDVKKIISDGTQIYSNLHNICCQNSKYDLVMGAADDIIFRTPRWSDKVLSTFDEIKDKIGYVFPNDGHHGGNLGTHGFFHKNWFNCLGYLSPPIFTVDYSDNYVMDLSRSINRCFYFPDVLVEHMHWTFGKSEFDKTAQDAHKKRISTDNRSIYESCESTLNSDRDKLLSFIGEK